MRILLQWVKKAVLRSLVHWLARPLAGSIPPRQRLRFYLLLLLLVVLTAPLHWYMNISLSPAELAAHMLGVLLGIVLAVLLVEGVLIGTWRSMRWKFESSMAGFWLKAFLIYWVAQFAITAIHDSLPFTRSIVEKHAQAGHPQMSFEVLPIAIVIFYILYQTMRTDHLARQVDELKQINRRLQQVQRERNQNPVASRTTYSPIKVKYDGTESTFNPETIIRIQIDENYCHFIVHTGPDKKNQMDTRRYIVRMTLNEAATLLPNALFVQTHRSHLVNLLYAAEIVRADRRRALCLTTGDYVPVSRTRINTVQSKLKAFVTVSQ